MTAMYSLCAYPGISPEYNATKSPPGENINPRVIWSLTHIPGVHVRVRWTIEWKHQNKPGCKKSASLQNVEAGHDTEEEEGR